MRCSDLAGRDTCWEKNPSLCQSHTHFLDHLHHLPPREGKALFGRRKGRPELCPLSRCSKPLGIILPSSRPPARSGLTSADLHFGRARLRCYVTATPLVQGPQKPPKPSAFLPLSQGNLGGAHEASCGAGSTLSRSANGRINAPLPEPS